MRRSFITLALFALACGGPNVSRVRPQLAPPPSPQDFGTLPVLHEKRVEVPVLNVGRAPLTVSNVTLGKADGVFQVIVAPQRVETGITENIVVAFVPPAEQTYEDTLRFETDDTDNPFVSVLLQGRGSTRAAMTVEPTALDFGRIGECSSSVRQLTIRSTGTADLVLNEIAFTDDTSPAYSFVGSTRTPATIPTTGSNGLPGEIQLTVKVAVAAGSTGALTGAIRLKTTDPERREVIIPLTTTVNRAPVPHIDMPGVAAPGQTVTLEGGASMDPDGDLPLSYRWTLRSKPLSSNTTLGTPDQPQTSMTLDPSVPGAYEVQLDVTDAQGVKNCMPARTTVVAAPAQKLLVELFWDNTGTDLDLHVTRTPSAPLFSIPDDCYYQNRTPDWGVPMGNDNPELLRDALTGYGPEVFGYVNPIDTTYRVTVVFNNDLLSPTPSSRATVRVYLYGILKAELQKTLTKKGDVWRVVDVRWPSGEVMNVP